MGVVRKHFENIAHLLPQGRWKIENVDCLMSALAVFVFKYPSMLQFDKDRSSGVRQKNIEQLFKCKKVPSDTQMRERLDTINPEFIRPVYKEFFKILQRSNTLKEYTFINGTYLVPVDATQYYSSKAVYCSSCCTKTYGDCVHYNHQVLSAALVHPDQKAVFPFAPEPIIQQDGTTKNDCEINAMKRWIKKFRADFPFLRITVAGDGLYAKAPLVEALYEAIMSFILIVKEDDHKYMFEWFNDGEAPERQEKTITLPNGTVQKYEWMHDVPLNGSTKIRVNVIRFTETDKNDKSTTWVWATDHYITTNNVQELVRGGRARWKIENEVFNTLKNQGYEFEHNYGHGKEHLSVVLMMLMQIAFFMDQILFKVNKIFQAAYERKKSKSVLWERMRFAIDLFDLTSFEAMYHFLAQPPPEVGLRLPNL